MAIIHVKAAPGLRFPMERNVRKYITPDAPVGVESSAYYRRAVTDGDLIVVIQREPQASAKAVQVKTTNKVQADE